MAPSLVWAPQNKGFNTRAKYLGYPEYAVDGYNFGEQNGLLTTRPNLIQATTSGITAAASIYLAQWVQISGTPRLIVATGNHKIWHATNTVTYPFTEITDSGTPYAANPLVRNVVVFLGSIIIPGQGGFAMTTSPYATYTHVAQPYLFMTSLQSRLLGAYKYTATNGERMIGWCVSGDATDWAGAGSGSITIADMEDVIQGLQAIGNNAFILRTTGVHVAYQTGIGTSAFRVEQFISDEDVCVDSKSVAVHGDAIYCLGARDVYRITLNGKESIGRPIWKTLEGRAATPPYAQYMGVIQHSGITDSIQEGAKHYYHLIPIGQSPLTAPWLVYCIEDDKWFVNQCDETISFATDMPFSAGGTIQLFDNASAHNILDLGYSDATTTALSDNASIESPYLTVGDDPTKDYTLSRILITHVDHGAYAVTVTATTELNGVVVTESKGVTLGTVAASGALMKTWVDIGRMVGQNFKFSISTAVPSRLAIRELRALFEEGGDFRG